LKTKNYTVKLLVSSLVSLTQKEKERLWWCY